MTFLLHRKDMQVLHYAICTTGTLAKTNYKADNILNQLFDKGNKISYVDIVSYKLAFVIAHIPP